MLETMFSVFRLYKIKSINPKFLFLLTSIFILSACGSSDDLNDTDSSGQGDNVSFQLPDSVFGDRLDQSAGTLTATISVNGGVATAMTISGTTASVTLDNVPTGNTSFTILFTYDLAPYGPLDVASATKNTTISEGSNAISFLAADYDTASFDADGDGISNILELDETSTSSPLVALCVLGTATLECELGT